MTRQAMIIDAIRIPRALSRPDGAYASVKPIDLLKPLFQTMAERHSLDTALVEDVILGCNTQTREQGANLGKIAPLYAGWHERVSGISVNRFCCSSLDAVNSAAANIMAGMQRLNVAGGVESLSRVPMFADKGSWFADPDVARATRFMHMGLAADLVANLRGYSRESLDRVALDSHRRAARAQEEGRFVSLVPIRDRQSVPVLVADNAVRPSTTAEKLAALPVRFSEAGEAGGAAPALARYPQLKELQYLHTAATSPALTDGASLLLLADAQKAEELGLKPRARLSAFAVASDEPVIMLTGHIRATEKLFANTGLTTADIDLFEVNESFAASVLDYRDQLAVPEHKLNVNGSALAMGHPLGATGGNLIGTLLDELKRRDMKRGIVAIPGGAGVGVATLIERV